MQAPFPREQTQLTHSEVDAFEKMASGFELSQEHLLDPSLMFYVTR
ncbi:MULTISPECIES: hypothetical protein [unclassified Corynebacterium]|nr:hypothetical protein [Corynebacterium sp.]MDY5784852.1 hypothetical protein [Corynebacterium sp.]